MDKPARVEEKYRDILVKLEDWKQVSQSRELISGPTSLQVAGQAKEPTKYEPPPPLPSGHINFPKQKKLLTFRTFEGLKAQRDTVGLIEKYVSDYPSCCSKFANLRTDQRMVIAREANLCVNYMGIDIKFFYL